MAVVSTKAGAITNRDASPRVLNDANINKGSLLEAVGTLEAASGDSVASKYFFCEVPSNARISRVLLSCDAIGTTTAADFGIYKSTEDGGAVVDADFFASAQGLATALTNSDITHESAVFGVEDVEKPLWSALGLTEDPKITYDVIGTLTGAADAAGTVSLKVQYVI